MEWFRNGDKLFSTDRIKMDREGTGLLRLSILGVDIGDVGKYSCRIFNPYGEDICEAELRYDCKYYVYVFTYLLHSSSKYFVYTIIQLNFTFSLALEPRTKRPLGDQYSEFDKLKRDGVPTALADKPIISRMTDRHLTLSWKPSIPYGPRTPVTYQVNFNI